jgi:hypothetical protein
VFIADVGDSPANWDTIDITIDDIERVLHRSERKISYEGS